VGHDEGPAREGTGFPYSNTVAGQEYLSFVSPEDTHKTKADVKSLFGSEVAS
jgi:hypothetical protein